MLPIQSIVKHLIIGLLLLSSKAVRTQDTITHSKFEFKLFNDTWGGALTQMNDDLRTFGFDFKYTSKNHFSLYSRFSSLTNRYPELESQRKRFDELYIKSIIPVLRFSSNEDFMAVILGIYAKGNFLGASFQNYIHRKNEVLLVELPYYTEKGYYPAIGFAISKYVFRKQFMANNYLSAQIKLTSEYLDKYLFLARLNIPFQINFDGDKYATLDIGYNLSGGLNKNELLNAVLKAESGIVFSLSMRSKNIFIYYKLFPSNSFSTGGIGLKLTPYSHKSVLNKSNAEIEVSLVNKGYGYNVKYARKIAEIFGRKASFIFNHNFHSLLKRYIPKYPDIHGSGIQITFGGEMDILKSEGLFELIYPYINVSTGLRVISLYSGRTIIDKVILHQFVVNNDIGVKLKLPYNGFSEKSNIYFSLYHRFMFLSYVQATEYTRKSWNPHKTRQSRFGAGIIFGF